MSLADSALELAAQGVTSLAEAIAVTSGLEEADDPITPVSTSPSAGMDPLTADALAAEARVAAAAGGAR
jgi:hypothetical protein